MASVLPPREIWGTGTTVAVAPLVRRVLAPNPSPFTYTGTQTWLVGDGADCAVIDPGPDGIGTEGHAATCADGHLEAILQGVGRARLRAILCTHTHRDHSPLARALAAATGAPVIGCAPLSLSDDGPRADAAFDTEYRADHVLADGEAIGGEGWTLRAVATPGHTSNHLCYALEATGALFTGDHVMGWSTTVIAPPDGDMGDYLASLAKLYDRAEDRVYFPAHGPQIDNPHQLVRSTIGHRRQRERQIIGLLAQGPHSIPELVAVMYQGLNPRLVGAAGLSVKAHLLELARQGRAGPEGDLWVAG